MGRLAKMHVAVSAVIALLASVSTVSSSGAATMESTIQTALAGTTSVSLNTFKADPRSTLADSDGNIYRTMPDGRRVLVARVATAGSSGSTLQRGANDFVDLNGNGIIDLLEKEANTLGPNKLVRAILIGRAGNEAAAVAESARQVPSVHINRVLGSISSVAISAPTNALGALAKLPSVLRIEPDLRVSIPQPNTSTTALRTTRPYAPMTAAEAVSGFSTWKGTLSGTGIDVAVVDTGVDARHVSLAGRVVLGGTFVATEGACLAPPTDRAVDVNGHGTHVAGIIGGDVASGGLAPSSRIISVRVFNCTGSGYMSDIDAALDWLINNRNTGGRNIRIANLSLGADVASDGTDATSRLVNRLSIAGVNVFVAAGNAGLSGKGSVGIPGSARYAITVGAFAAEAAGGVNQAFFSSTGPVLSGAPKPDISAPGVDIKSALANTTDFTAGLSVTGTRVLTGTSMATPWAAGLAALALQQQSNRFPTGTRCDSCADGVSGVNSPMADLMRRTASDRSKSGWDGLFGFGVIEPARVLVSESSSSRYATFATASERFNEANSRRSFRIAHTGGVMAMTIDPDVSVSESRNVRVLEVTLRNSTGAEVPLDVGRYFFQQPDGTLYMSWVMDFAALQYTSGTSLPAGNYFLYVALANLDADVYIDVSRASSVTSLANWIGSSINTPTIRPGSSGTLTLSVSNLASGSITFSPRADAASGVTFSPTSVTVARGGQASVTVSANSTSTLSGSQIYAQVTSAASADGLVGYRTIPVKVALALGLNSSPRVDGLSQQAGSVATGELAELDAGSRVIPVMGGQLVFFTSSQALVPGAVAGMRQIYIKDRRIANGLRLLGSGLGRSDLFDVTPDGATVLIGTYVALSENDINSRYDLYTVNVATGAATLVSLRTDNSQHDYNQFTLPGLAAALSDDGKKVAFQTYLDFAPGEVYFSDDVYLRNLTTNTTTRITNTTVGGLAAGYSSINFDPTGRYLVFAQARYFAAPPPTCPYVTLGYADGSSQHWGFAMYRADLNNANAITMLTPGDSRCVDWGGNTTFNSSGRLFYFEYSQTADRTLINGTLTPTSLGSAVPAPDTVLAEVIGVDGGVGRAAINVYLLDYTYRQFLTEASLTTKEYWISLDEMGRETQWLSYAKSTSGSLVVGGYAISGLINFDDNGSLDPYVFSRGRATVGVSTFAPTTGTIGSSVTISGVGFTGTTAVTFGGVQASTFTVVTDSQIIATVPNGAVSGPIAVAAVAGTASSSGTFTVGTSSTPSKPLPPTAVLGNTQITVNWLAPNANGATITSYEVTMATSLTGSYRATCSVATTTCLVTGLRNGTSYYFKVRATNAVGSSSYSDAGGPFVPGTTPSAPAAPAGTVGNSQVILNWGAPANNGSIISYYEVNHSSNGGGTWVSSTGTCAGAVGALTCTASSLTNGTPYVFRVRAVNAFGAGAWSANSVVLTPSGLTLTVPSAVTNLRSTAVSAGTVSVLWGIPLSDGGSTITGYEYRYKLTTSTKWINWSSAGNTLSVTLSRLKPGSAYNVEVRAINSVGAGPSSALTFTSP